MNMPPHFLCIGAQKSGTTWLYENLRHHPEIWLPPRKEVHYFDRPQWPYILTVFSKNQGKRRRFYRKLRSAIYQMKDNRKYFPWYARYYLFPRNHRWYQSLFMPTSSQITGDITPAYAGLVEENVRIVQDFIPNAKIIYLLRNPIDRIWSHAAMYFSVKQDQEISESSAKQLEAFLTHPRAIRYSDYIRTIELWQRYFPKENFFIGFFDQLRQQPDLLLKSIFQFLEVNTADDYIMPSAGQKVFARSYPNLPRDLALTLAHTYRPQIEQLHVLFNNQYTEDWVTHVESLEKGC